MAFSRDGGSSSSPGEGTGGCVTVCDNGEPPGVCKWTVRCVVIKFSICVLLARLQLLNVLILLFAVFSVVSDQKKRLLQTHLPEDTNDPSVDGEIAEDLPKTAETEPEFDSLLPDEVKGVILEHADHEDVSKLKTVSKRWCLLIENEIFIPLLSTKAQSKLTACTFFVKNGVWHWTAFDPTANKWRRLPPLTFLPPNCTPDADLFKQFLFTTSNGLVCANFSKSSHEDRLIVFNPLTRQHRQLPPLLNRRNPVLLHILADPASQSYQILAAGSSQAGDEHMSRVCEWFDSRTGKWERVGDLPPPDYCLNEYQSGVFHNDHIFCIGFSETPDQVVKCVLRYNVAERAWSSTWTEEEEEEGLPSSTILQLVDNDGEVYLFSERENGRETEHCVQKFEWIEHEGDVRRMTFKLIDVARRIKKGGKSLEVYPEYVLVPFKEKQLCIYNVVEHTGVVLDVEDREKKWGALVELPQRFRGAMSFFTLNSASFLVEPRFAIKVF